MLAKLNLKDFSEQTIRAINKLSLTELSNLKLEDVRFLGEITSANLIDRIAVLKSSPIADYVLVGSLGFSSIAIEKWKTIFNKIDIIDLIVMTERNKGYQQMFFEAIIKYKSDIFIFIQGYYRCFMQNKHFDKYPQFNI